MTTTEEIPNITKTEKRIITALSKSAYTVKELSILLNTSTSAVTKHLCNLREKGLISHTPLLSNPSIKLYFCKGSVKSSS